MCNLLFKVQFWPHKVKQAHSKSILQWSLFALLQTQAPQIALASNDIEWVRQFGTPPPQGMLQATRIEATANDSFNAYVVGYTNGSLPGQLNLGRTDAFIRKLSNTGIEIWTRQFGTNGDDEAKSVAIDVTGIYITGKMHRTSSTGDVFDLFVRKYDFNGTALWTDVFIPDQASSDPDSYGIAVNNGGVYVAGSYDTNPGRDAFVRKYDLNGQVQWTQTFGSEQGGEYDAAEGITVDATSVYVVGYVNGILPGQTGSGTGEGDSFIRKYDTNGNVVWTHQFGTTQRNWPNVRNEATAVTVDCSGDIYLSGLATGNDALDGLIGSKTGNVYLRKYHPDGQLAWTRQFGTSTEHDFANSVAADCLGIYVAGYTEGNLSGQNQGGGDAFVLKYDANGNEVWRSQFGTNQSDVAFGVTVFSGNVYIGGSTNGSFPGSSFSGGLYDAFIAKIPSYVSNVSCAGKTSCNGGLCTVSKDGSSMSYSDSVVPGFSDISGFRYKTSGGVLTWNVKGKNRSFAQQSFYRLSNESHETSFVSVINPEFDVTSSCYDATAAKIFAIYDGSATTIRVGITYSLLGKIPGRESMVIRDVEIINKNSSSPIGLTWFDYGDFDVAEAPSSDNLVQSYLHAGTRVIDQYGGSLYAESQWPITVQDGHYIYGQPEAFKVSSWGGNPISYNLLVDLLNDTITTLPNVSEQTLPNANDWTHAVQFSFTDVTSKIGMRMMTTLLPTGDIDGDGDVDQDDLNIVLAARNGPVLLPNSDRHHLDLDGDGKITVLDARKLTLLCTRPLCATR